MAKPPTSESDALDAQMQAAAHGYYEGYNADAACRCPLVDTEGTVIDIADDCPVHGGAAPSGAARMRQLSRSQNSDAAAWASAFAQAIREGLDPTDEGWLIGVFANAINTGFDRGRGDPPVE